MNICEKACIAGINYEECNSELKREYILKNIFFIDKLMSQIDGYCGSFGTGYPFYALNNNLEGRLPIISEQKRYELELLKEVKELDSWKCSTCLSTSANKMPDLKQICIPCPKVKSTIKPRKVMNRLPDIDMWMISEDSSIDRVKIELENKFKDNNMYTSDIDPVGTIDKVYDIVKSLKSEEMPDYYLPIDIHIIEYSKMKELIDSVPYSVFEYISKGEKPYLPIHPISLRKKWQYDDSAYNFVLDFLFSMHPFNWDDLLMNKLITSRRFIAKELNFPMIEETFKEVSSNAVRRRYENTQIKRLFKRRIKEWEKE